MSQRCNSTKAGAVPDEADVIDSSTPGDDDAADGPVVADNDDPSTSVIPIAVVDSADDAPAIQDEDACYDKGSTFLRKWFLNDGGP